MPENDYDQTYYEGELNPSYVTASPSTKSGQRKLKRARGRAQTAQAIQTYMTDSKLPTSVLSERARNGDPNAYLSLVAQGRDEDTKRVIRFGAANLGAGLAAAAGAAAVPVIESIGAGTFAIPGFVGTAGRMLGNGLGKVGEFISPVFNNPVAKFYFSRPVQAMQGAATATPKVYNWVKNGEKPSASEAVSWGLGTGLGVALGGNWGEALKAAYEIPGYLKGMAQTGVDLGKEIGINIDPKKFEAIGDKLENIFYRNIVQNGASGINYSFKLAKDWFPDLYNRINVPSYRAIKMMNEKVPIGLRREMEDFIIDYNISKANPGGSTTSVLKFPSTDALDNYTKYIYKTKFRPEPRLDAFQNRIAGAFDVPNYTHKFKGINHGGYEAYTSIKSDLSANRITFSNTWLKNLKAGDVTTAKGLTAHELQHISDRAYEIVNPIGAKYLNSFDNARSHLLKGITRTEPNLQNWYYDPSELRAEFARWTAVSPTGQPYDYATLPTAEDRAFIKNNVGRKFYFETTPQNNSKFSSIVTMYPGLKQGGKLIKRKHI